MEIITFDLCVIHLCDCGKVHAELSIANDETSVTKEYDTMEQALQGTLELINEFRKKVH